MSFYFSGANRKAGTCANPGLGISAQIEVWEAIYYTTD